MITRTAFGFALLTLSAGCPLLEVEAEMPEVCMIHRDVQVDGVAPAGSTQIEEQFGFDDLSAFAPLKNLDADLRFVSATVRATHGVGNLAFIRGASVTIASGDPDSALPTHEFYACDGDCPAKDDALMIPVQDQDDALAYIATGSLVIDLRATGHMPAEAWTMDVEICVAGRAAYSL